MGSVFSRRFLHQHLPHENNTSNTCKGAWCINHLGEKLWVQAQAASFKGSPVHEHPPGMVLRSPSSWLPRAAGIAAAIEITQELGC